MKCPNCGWDANKEETKQYPSFNDFTNKVLKRVRDKLQKETGYGIPERRMALWQPKKRKK